MAHVLFGWTRIRFVDSNDLIATLPSSEYWESPVPFCGYLYLDHIDELIHDSLVSKRQQDRKNVWRNAAKLLPRFNISVYKFYSSYYLMWG